MKGCASASYYPSEDRQMGDVIFGAAGRRGKGREGTGAAGFRNCPSAAQHIHHIAYAWKWGSRLHFAVGGTRREAGQRIRSFVSDILESSRTIPVEGSSICVPDDFHHGLNLLLHTNQHLLGEGLACVISVTRLFCRQIYRRRISRSV
ncbi:MAG: hypothetical protein ACLUOI_34710 [Eisenbergiella sp.]